MTLLGLARVVLSKLLEVHDVVTESWLPVTVDPRWLALHIAENLICNFVSLAQWFCLFHLILFFTGFVDPSSLLYVCSCIKLTNAKQTINVKTYFPNIIRIELLNLILIYFKI